MLAFLSETTNSENSHKLDRVTGNAVTFPERLVNCNEPGLNCEKENKRVHKEWSFITNISHATSKGSAIRIDLYFPMPSMLLPSGLKSVTAFNWIASNLKTEVTYKKIFSSSDSYTVKMVSRSIDVWIAEGMTRIRSEEH